MEYKEKLRLAKEALDSGSYDKDTIEYIFPELAESKDERMRKALIEGFKVMKNGSYGECTFSNYNIPVTDIIAWLEKQGEHKPTAEEVLIKAGLKPYKDGNQWCVLLGDNIQEGVCGFGNTIEDALYAFLKDLIASQGEQKSVKVPKFKAGDFIQFNGMGHTRYTVKEVCGLSHYINTLDKRMDMSYTDANFELVEQKPAEWSEEDKERIEQICHDLKSGMINFYANEVVKGLHYKEIIESNIEWLKSLSPQSTWKPSDEQMKLLDSICASNYLTTTNTRVLQELYDALKKLKE